MCRCSWPMCSSGLGDILASLACLSAEHSGLRRPLTLEDTSALTQPLASRWGSEEALAQERLSFPVLSALCCTPCAHDCRQQYFGRPNGSDLVEWAQSGPPSTLSSSPFPRSQRLLNREKVCCRAVRKVIPAPSALGNWESCLSPLHFPKH